MVSISQLAGLFCKKCIYVGIMQTWQFLTLFDFLQWIIYDEKCIMFNMMLTFTYMSVLEAEIDYVRVLNRVLPKDIRVTGWCPVPIDFSARLFSFSWFTLFWFDTTCIYWWNELEVPPIHWIYNANDGRNMGGVCFFTRFSLSQFLAGLAVWAGSTNISFGEIIWILWYLSIFLFYDYFIS